MRSAIFVALLLMHALASAAGVPLITPAAPLAASDPIRAHWPADAYPAISRLHAVNLNRAAFGAPLVTVVIDGKTHTFAGSMVKQPPPVHTMGHDANGNPISVLQVQPESWVGFEGENQITLTKNGGELAGTIRMPDRAFVLRVHQGRAVLTESRYEDLARIKLPADKPGGDGATRTTTPGGIK